MDGRDRIKSSPASAGGVKKIHNGEKGGLSHKNAKAPNKIHKKIDFF